MLENKNDTSLPAVKVNKTVYSYTVDITIIIKGGETMVSLLILPVKCPRR